MHLYHSHPEITKEQYFLRFVLKQEAAPECCNPDCRDSLLFRSFEAGYPSFCSMHCKMKRQWHTLPEFQREAHRKRAGRVMSKLHANEEWAARNRQRLINLSSDEFYRGKYISKKAGTLPYLSSLELTAFIILDKNPEVKSFSYEPLRIPYEFDGKQHRYYPDILVEKANGERTLLEIKDHTQLGLPINQAKFKQARRYCRANGLAFKVWTQYDMSPYAMRVKNTIRAWRRDA